MPKLHCQRLRDVCKSRVPLRLGTLDLQIDNTAQQTGGKLRRTLVLLSPLPALQAAIQIDSKTEDGLPL